MLLQEWLQGNLRPRTREELFNLQHSSLRNVVERVYGVAKKRFPLLAHMSSYPFRTQVDLVMSCFMLHNFVRQNQLYTDEFNILDHNGFHLGEPDANVPPPDDDDDDAEADAVRWRDDIAQRMWDDYVEVLAARGGDIQQDV